MKENSKYEKKWDRFKELLLSTEREGIETIIDYLEEHNFRKQPASTRYHLSFEGGLLEHSLNVYETFRNLNKSFNLGFDKNTVIIVSLLHDICKADVYHPNKYKNKDRKPYYFWDSNPLGHGEKSLIILLKNGIKLTEKEEKMIRWHMGFFDNEFSSYEKMLKKNNPEIFALFISDYLATHLIENDNFNNKKKDE